MKRMRRLPSLLALILLAFACSGVATPTPGDDPEVPNEPPGEDPPLTNRAPVFDNAPPSIADHNRLWAFDVALSDADGDDISLSVLDKPGWMSFDPTLRRFSGIAGRENIGPHQFELRASDGTDSTSRTFTVDVVEGDIVCDQDFGDPAQSDYILPYRAGKSYEVIQSYCSPDPTWGHHTWFAYDFDFVTGDTIVASRAGLAWFVREDQPNIGGNCSGGKENIIFVLHDDGTVMSYAHLTTNGSFVSTGERIEQGQPIGLSGNSGCSSGPHLHVSLHRSTDDLGAKGSLPMNYSNAMGPLDENRGLIYGARYEAAAAATK